MLPALALLPGWLLAIAVFWLPVRAFVSVPYWLFALCYLAAGVLLFLRPVQRLVLAPLLGARRPTVQEQSVIDPLWVQVAQAAHADPRSYVLAVLDADEINAFASGGHLVVVTTYAIEVMTPRELSGVLAHELSHHLGFHTVALTVAQWLSLPIVVLARIGFFLQNVARAATDSFASRSTGLTIIGTAIAVVLRAVAWVFLFAIMASNAIGNAVGRRAEFQADARVVQMGFGGELAAALRRFVASGLAERPDGWRERLFVSHPPARTRVARIEALLREQNRNRRR